MDDGNRRDQAVAGRFVRTDRTWLAYGALASYAYCLYGLGPVLALLHAQLHLSYTLTSLHSTLWGAGSIITGVAYPRLSQRVGRRRVFWGAAAAMSFSALLFAIGYHLGVTLLAATVLGLAGSALLTGTTAILADEHGALRDRALVEANVGASLTAIFVPAVIGGLAATAVGWRVAMVVPVVALATLWLRFRSLPLTSAPASASVASAGRLPGQYWLCATLAAVVGGIEFCFIFYAALFLHAHAGLSTQRAVAALSIFYLGELVGRAGGSRLARTAGRGRRIIGLALALTIGGFAVFWLGRPPAVAVTGLAVAGVGGGNLYPFTLAQAVAAAPGRTDQASARALLAIAAATLVAPFTLGALADRVGLTRAYLVEPCLIAAAVILLFATRPVGRAVAAAAAGKQETPVSLGGARR
jgi:predicted MFS family arabinose efflux permease